MKISSERVSSEYLSLNSCGIDYISDRDRGSDRAGGRCDYHILYVEKGICNVYIDEECVRAGAGSVILFRPFEPQRYFFLKSDNSVSHYVHFSGVGCEHILKKLGIYDVKILNIGKSREYEAISRQMLYELIMAKPIAEVVCSAYLLELLSIIGRRCALIKNNVTVKSESRINDACALIYDNINDPPSAESLAQKCFLSVSRFLHLFKEITGKSYNEFIAFIRMSNAKELLVNTDMSIKEIALSLGFDDQNYFSRVFRKIEGCSPTEYKEQMK